MRDFNRWYNGFLTAAPLYRALGRLSGLRPREMGGKIAFQSQPADEVAAAAPQKVPLHTWVAFVREMAQSPVGLFEGWALSGLATDGPRVFCPTADECHALSQIEMNVPWEAYRQPFDTFVVALPDGFYPRAVSPDVGKPVACVSRLDADARVMSCTVMCLLDGGQPGNSLTGQYAWRPGAVDTIERHVSVLPNDGSLNDTEDAAQDRVKRILINACLLLTQYGCRPLGPASPEHVARLRTSLGKKRLPPAIAQANRDALTAAPMLYGFDQHIRVFDRTGDDHGEGGGHHTSAKPHWRRGHWARQPCGTGLTERRLVFRRPVLVNAHRLGGDVADTRVTLTMGGHR